MTKTQRLRMTIDITMTILSIILMGGNYLFPADIVHEILGVGLFVLWALHIILNRRWYGAIFKGKYNPYRVMQTVINCCILICTIFLMISGIILSNHIFTFLNIQGGLGFARIAHLLASHWYYLFMSLHIGLHVGRLFQDITAKIIPRIILALVCAYGIYAFIARGVWKYLILRQQFFFFDLDRGYILFAIDYISIIILFATLSHLLAKSLKKGKL
ncbi:protein of unknown function [Treponema bryantii]|uniref:Uncharacterized protein n=1 Tax=Treponema bryantii TaxID=163 RepID=A0A1I3N0N1_9SPIR|nr:DUF4405 domain-containing protein [Treponema bryantii]SFJ02808.1 protein of unknown function [Treponema bryantii]